MRVFDDTLGVILDWAKGRSDTLVLVTADHETGDFAFSYAKDSIPAPMELPGSAFRGRLYEAKHRSVDPEVLDRIYAQRQAYEPFRDAFLALPARERTPERLASAFNAISEFPITPEQARDILEHPEVREFREFYDGAENNLTGLLARAVAGQQGVVWGTGGHTATPVLLVAFGSRDRAALFSGVHHSTEVGGLMMDSLGLRAQARDKGTSRSRNRSAQALQASQVKLP
jgi:alkaline phosphatase